MRLFSDVASKVDDPYLHHAAALALRGRGSTSPNPMVGAVVVRDGRIVGEGFHPRAGEPHAEVFALADAGVSARGAEMYVTLEPCRHHGRTPPCTDAIIAAGIARVVIGMRDSTKEATGGAEVLRDAGIAVEFADDPEPFAEINAGWLKRNATGLPYVTAKVALSLDGRPGFSAGERASISGDSGSEVTRRLRRACDAVLVGAATAIADDPALTVGTADGGLAEHQPLRVVLVREQVPSADSKLFVDGHAPSMVLASSEADDAALDALPDGVIVERYDERAGLRGAFAVLGARGMNDVLVEPGPRLLTSLWTSELIDELVVVSAGGMVGPQGPDVFLGDAERRGDVLAHRYTPVEAGVFGDVCVNVWRPV